MISKNIRRALAAVAAALTICATAFAALSADAARELAEDWIPSGSDYQSMKEDRDEFEFYFFNAALATKYEVEVSKSSASVVEVKSKLRDGRGSNTVVLSEAQAGEILRSEFPNAAIQKIELDGDGAYQVYEIEFTDGSIRGEVKINPENGVVIEQEIKY